jgi:hypothetical protein
MLAYLLAAALIPVCRLIREFKGLDFARTGSIATETVLLLLSCISSQCLVSENILTRHVEVLNQTLTMVTKHNVTFLMILGHLISNSGMT